MKRWVFLALISLFTNCYAVCSLDIPYKLDNSCPQALPTNDPQFCASFESAASCRCRAAGIPAALCTNVDKIYQRMIALYGSEDRACRYQHDTSYQNCMDDWQCYRQGGTDSQGNLCSSTGNACE